MTQAAEPLEVAAPYPLARLYHRRVLPALLLAALAGLLIAVWGTRDRILSVYLRSAQASALSVLAATQRAQPDDWAGWVGGFGQAATPFQWPALGEALDRNVQDRALRRIRVYDSQGVVRYATDRSLVGGVEREGGIEAALRTRHSLAVAKTDDSGPLYELYVYLEANPQRPQMVVELYEPAELLQNQLWSAMGLAAVGAGLLFATALGLLTRTVHGAQRAIDRQAEVQQGLVQRLSSLVSRRAVGAALAGEPSGHLLDASLYYADVSGFTGYSESHPPEDAVRLLNRLIGLQVRHIHANGGDVDKFIGDAVLAVFVGPDRAQRAMRCAQAVLGELHTDAQARSLRIGLHDGWVIAGRIGTADRQDDTVIGDAVNVAARLCTAADAGELMCDVNTAARSGLHSGFSAPQELVLKGRQEPVRVRRWRAPDVQRPS
jgi:class 3 adenylate cyclase